MSNRTKKKALKYNTTNPRGIMNEFQSGTSVLNIWEDSMAQLLHIFYLKSNCIGHICYPFAISSLLLQVQVIVLQRTKYPVRVLHSDPE